MTDRAYAYRSLWEAGAVVANGSDAPIEDLDPLARIRAGVLRAWHPEQRLTVEQSLEASTVTPAWLAREERRRGEAPAGLPRRPRRARPRPGHLPAGGARGGEGRRHHARRPLGTQSPALVTLWPHGGLWRHADFLRLWGAATVSQLGSQITLLALPLAAVLVLEASAFQVALLTTFDFLQFLLFGLPAGVWVDRLARRPVMIATDVARALALLTIPLAYALDVLTLPQLYAVGFLVGVLTVFFELAHTSYLPSLVEREQLIDGNSKLEISRSGAYIAGPGLGGVLVGLLTAPGAIVVDALSFVVSGVLLVRIRAHERWAASAPARTGLRRELAEGLRYVLGHRYLWPIASCTAILNLFWNAAFAVYFVFLARELDLGPALIGLVLMLGNLGWLAGALVAGRVTGRLGVGWTLAGAAFLFGPSGVLIAVAPESAPLPFLISAQALGSFAGVLYNITSMTLRQSVTPDRLQGRTVGAIRTVVWGVTPLGALLGGALASVVGLRATFWIAAVGSAAAALPILLSSARELRGMPEAEPEPAT